MGGNLISNSTSIVSGLLMSKRGKKNGVEIIIDDFSGSLSIGYYKRIEKQLNAYT